MKRYIFFFLMAGMCFPAVSGQNTAERPDDYLKPDFHQGRREALRAQMPPNSVAVFFANPVRNRANDVDYKYHQNPDFYYLTGYTEPNSMLMIFSDKEVIEGNECNELLFVQPKNKTAEMWTGRRLGVEGAGESLGISCVYENGEFETMDLALTDMDRVFFRPMKDDIRNTYNKADLYDLVKAFREKILFPEEYDPQRFKLYDLIRTTEIENSANVAQVIDRYFMMRSQPDPDDPLDLYRKAESDRDRKAVAEKIPDYNIDGTSLTYMMANLREIKTPEEMVLLRKAIYISAVAQTEVMKAMKPGMSETEIQGIHEYVYRKYGSEFEGYPSIVGAGENSCILHYIDNIRPELNDDLVLMDVGAEYHGYTADVTRTVPANGKFSPEQKAIYELVYEAQEAAFKACKAGNAFSAPHLAAQKVINEGLAKLGLVKPGVFHSYFPHGTSHYLGLDVHDLGNHGPFQANTVITVEPGIYIPKGSPCDEKWWGIGVRIEDDVLITEDGYEVLSRYAPRTVEGIEAMMARPSALDDFVLPELETLFKP